MRGQRVFCSNRGQRGGCGLTFSLFLADILPRHTVRATLFWQLLCQWLAGASLRAAAQSLRLPFALETLYGLVRRLRLRLPSVRPWLAQRQPAPPAQAADPLFQTTRHLQQIFPAPASALRELQLLWGRPLMG